MTWDREIAPIMQTRCAACHGDQGRARIPLMTYEEARPWAKAIKEEVLTRRMPKWQAVRGYGDFSNDPSLSPFEIALIVAWADGGAPKTLPGTSQPRVAFLPPQEFKPPNLPRRISMPCGARTLPEGRLVGIQPRLAAGQALKVVVETGRSGPVPLLWVKDFDEEFAEIYWLRSPLPVLRGRHRNLTPDSEGCTLSLFYETD